MTAKDKAPLSAAEMLGDDEAAAPAFVAAPTADVEVPDLGAAIDEQLKAAEDEKLRAEGIDPNHPVLSVDEQRAAIDAAHALVDKERKKAAAEALKNATVEAIRGKAGMTTGDPVRDEMVFLTVDVAEYTDRIMMNGTIYMHGHTYKVHRHVADSMREMMARTHEHQATIDGKGRAEIMKRQRNTMLSPLHGVSSAPTPAPQVRAA